ncbi:uncharacterized protein FOMMEDRAFT_23807 [Fomitiporia mediterranea MF3/22]|uniref:uncharacterized protein n=1 Tax=Fomitiporia mediterranea (strain MF3/22) TaxID=694068 RepID=UPI00044080A1|nr:uncharacterized protein FOMMEDRAFT_23807 [Fomitiporia mediterranea MF3/22]EJC98234.1 hypothetical protein FOMMEDRAFT_23807 [Fomitiporia mediterranea MF3/22]
MASTDPTLSGANRAALNCLYWGFAVATILLGMTLIQGFIYFRNYVDKRPLRVLVASLMTLDILSSFLTAHVLYYYMIENYGNPTSLSVSPPVTFTIEFFLTTTVTFLSQSFYATQIYKLHKSSPNRFLSTFAAMAFFTLSAFISNTISTILIVVENYFTSAAKFSVDVLKVFTSLGSCCASASDIIACSSLCLFLVSHRADLGRGHTTLVDTLLFYTINRGLLFTVAQIGRMAAYLSAPMMLYWLPFHLCLSKLHVNSLLALLNSRHALRGAAQEVSKIDFRVDPLPAGTLRAPQPNPPAVVRPTCIELRQLRDSSHTANCDSKFESSPALEAQDHHLGLHTKPALYDHNEER